MQPPGPPALFPASRGVAQLAHQGGWDEILLVVGPLAVVAGLLWLANRRVSAQLEATRPEAQEGSDGATEATDRP